VSAWARSASRGGLLGRDGNGQEVRVEPGLAVVEAHSPARLAKALERATFEEHLTRWEWLARWVAFDGAQPRQETEAGIGPEREGVGDAPAPRALERRCEQMEWNDDSAEVPGYRAAQTRASRPISTMAGTRR